MGVPGDGAKGYYLDRGGILVEVAQHTIFLKINSSS
jgi:hypothetical protein